MARDLTTVAAGKPFGGGLSYAPLGTTLPTDASTALDATFKSLGPISNDGITPSDDTSTEKPKEWDGSTLAQLLTDESRSFEFKLLGLFSDEVHKFVRGSDNVTTSTTAGDPKIAVKDKGGKPDQCVLVFEMKYEDQPMRVVVPVADSVVTGEEPWGGSGLMGYTITTEALKDSNGVRVYEYYGEVPTTP